MAAPTLNLPSEFVTLVLGTEATTVASAPANAAVLVRGFVLGTAGAFAYFATQNGVFGAVPAANPFNFYGGAFTVPCGERFEIYIAPGQSLSALGSIASSTTGGVAVSLSRSFLTPEPTFEVAYGVPLDSADSFVGPRPGFRRR